MLPKPPVSANTSIVAASAASTWPPSVLTRWRRKSISAARHSQASSVPSRMPRARSPARARRRRAARCRPSGARKRSSVAGLERGMREHAVAEAQELRSSSRARRRLRRAASSAASTAQRGFAAMRACSGARPVPPRAAGVSSVALDEAREPGVGGTQAAVARALEQRKPLDAQKSCASGSLARSGWRPASCRSSRLRAAGSR